MSSLRRRALIAALTVITAAGGAIAAAPSASAHLCAAVSLNSTVIGGCHTPPNPSGHVLCPSVGSGSTYVIVCTP